MGGMGLFVCALILLVCVSDLQLSVSAPVPPKLSLQSLNSCLQWRVQIIVFHIKLKGSNTGKYLPIWIVACEYLGSSCYERNSN